MRSASIALRSRSAGGMYWCGPDGQRGPSLAGDLLVSAAVQLYAASFLSAWNDASKLPKLEWLQLGRACVHRQSATAAAIGFGSVCAGCWRLLQQFDEWGRLLRSRTVRVRLSMLGSGRDSNGIRLDCR